MSPEAKRSHRARRMLERARRLSRPRCGALLKRDARTCSLRPVKNGRCAHHQDDASG